MDPKTWAEAVAVKTAEICMAMHVQAEAKEVRPGLWTINQEVYLRDNQRHDHLTGRLIDVCIRSEDFAPEEIATGHSYTVGLEWQHSEPFGFFANLDQEAYRLLVKAACRAVFEVALREAIARLEALKPEVARAAWAFQISPECGPSYRRGTRRPGVCCPPIVCRRERRQGCHDTDQSNPNMV